MVVVAQGGVDLQGVAGPGDGHVQQPPLLLDALGVTGGHVGREHTVAGVQQVDDVPLAALGRVDGGQDEPVLVEQGRAGQVGGGPGRVEGEVADEPAPADRSGRDLFQAAQVVDPGRWRGVDPFDHRRQPTEEPLDLHARRGSGPARQAAVGALGQRRPQQGQLRPGRRGDGDGRGEEPGQRGEGRVDGAAIDRFLRAQANGGHAAAGGGGADALQQLEEPEPGQLVARVVEHPQQGHQVLDVGGLEELEPAVLYVRDVAADQLQLEQVGVVGGPEQHRLVVESHAVLPVGQHRVAHRLGLGHLVGAGAQQRPAGAGDLRPQLHAAKLRVAKLRAGRGLGHDGVGHGEDGRGGAVVLLEADHGGAGEPVGEGEDVPTAGGAEAVDGLGVVADDREPGTVGSQGGQDVGLEGVGVLVLVDEHVVEQPGQQPGYGVEGPPVQEQVVVVEELVLALAGHVALEDGPDAVGLLGAPGERPLEDGRQPLAGVDDPVVDGGQRGRLREAAAAPDVGEAEVVADEAEQLHGVALVEDREPGIDAQTPAVEAKHAVGDGVERAAPHPPSGPGRGPGECAVGTGQAPGPAQHLLGRPPAEGEQAHPIGDDARAQQAGHPVGERAGLAGAGPGQDEQRTAVVLDGSELLGIQVEHAFAPYPTRAARRGSLRGDSQA